MGKFDQYKIDLKGMKQGAYKYEFVLDNLFFANIDDPDVQKGKVHVNLSVKRISSAVFELDFQIEGVVWIPCDRCLDDMEQPITSLDKLLVKFGIGYSEEGDNLVIIPGWEGIINVAWFMYEFVILAIPMKHVHALGKCNRMMISKLDKHLRTVLDDGEDGVAMGFGEEEEPSLNERPENTIDHMN